MAIYTQADLAAVAAKYIELATSGIATVTVGGQTVTIHSLDQYDKVIAAIKADMSQSNPHYQLQMVTLVPPGAG